MKIGGQIKTCKHIKRKISNRQSRSSMELNHIQYKPKQHNILTYSKLLDKQEHASNH